MLRKEKHESKQNRGGTPKCRSTLPQKKEKRAPTELLCTCQPKVPVDVLTLNLLLPLGLRDTISISLSSGLVMLPAVVVVVVLRMLIFAGPIVPVCFLRAPVIELSFGRSGVDRSPCPSSCSVLVVSYPELLYLSRLSSSIRSR